VSVSVLKSSGCNSATAFKSAFAIGVPFISSRFISLPVWNDFTESGLVGAAEVELDVLGRVDVGFELTLLVELDVFDVDCVDVGVCDVCGACDCDCGVVALGETSSDLCVFGCVLFG
jgi:hypothetical protein